MAAIERAERDGAAVRRAFAALHTLGSIVGTAPQAGHITDVCRVRGGRRHRDCSRRLNEIDTDQPCDLRSNANTIWIIADAGHAVTTVLLPEEY